MWVNQILYIDNPWMIWVNKILQVSRQETNICYLQVLNKILFYNSHVFFFFFLAQYIIINCNFNSFKRA